MHMGTKKWKSSNPPIFGRFGLRLFICWGNPPPPFGRAATVFLTSVYTRRRFISHSTYIHFLSLGIPASNVTTPWVRATSFDAYLGEPCNPWPLYVYDLGGRSIWHCPQMYFVRHFFPFNTICIVAYSISLLCFCKLYRIFTVTLSLLCFIVSGHHPTTHKQHGTLAAWAAPEGIHPLPAVHF